MCRPRDSPHPSVIPAKAGILDNLTTFAYISLTPNRSSQFMNFPRILVILFALQALALTAFAQDENMAVIDVQLKGKAKELFSPEEKEFLSQVIRGQASQILGGSVNILSQASYKKLVRANSEGCNEAGCFAGFLAEIGVDLGVQPVVSFAFGSLNLTLEVADKRSTIASRTFTAPATPEGKNKLGKEAQVAAKELFTEVAVRMGILKGAQLSQTAREGTREESGTGELDMGEAPVLVRLESTPAGAVAMIDGKLACSSTPCGKTLSAGVHSIQFGLERYLDTTLSITVRSGMPKVAVKLTPGWGTLDIATTPTGQPVQVNGKDQGASPLHLELSPGIYEIALGNDCMRHKTVTVNLARGQSRQVSETLVVREAGLSLQATDVKTGDDLAARVFVDGKQVGETPYVGKVSTCAQTIEVEADGYPRTEVKVQLMEGKKMQATVKLEKGSQGMATIPAGCFQMGSTDGEADEKPVHQVCLSAFNMDKTEVTQGQYRSVMGKSGYTSDGSCWAFNSATGKYEQGAKVTNDFLGDTKPVMCLDWSEAKAYCEHVGKRLPTEAEFEYANRAGTTTKYFWGNNPDQGCRYANGTDQALLSNGSSWNAKMECKDGYGDALAPVGSFLPNAWGLFDITGNVWEWSSDWYLDSYYGQSPSQNPEGASSGSSRVIHGGSWRNDPAGLRSAYRDRKVPEYRGTNLGFRCVSAAP
jgi:formylglycine-generating enzyme required for sulfatase activity